jgi:two-component system, sensor histidine kinase YesM
MMAQINRDRETSNMAFVLGKIMRYSISRSKIKVKLSEEISHINDYVSLQRTRFKDIFRIEINIDKSLYDCIIIKMILQPAIENAIYHGLSDTPSNGFIKISGYRENEDIIFEVADNGKGILPYKVRKLNGYINDLNNSFTSVGLKNVNKRIKLYYGSKYGLNVYSEYGKGTTVKITVPFEDEKNSDEDNNI